jgi:hypothetical protein
MAYTIRKGKLHFEPRTGNGPCNRRHVGKANRRITASFTRDGVEHRYHATKGWRTTRVEG